MMTRRVPTNKILRRRLQAGVILQDPKANEDVLKQLHMKQVSEVVERLKSEGEEMKMTQDVKRFRANESHGFQTVLYHGITASPNKKTFVRTYLGGRMESWTESL